MKPPETGSLDRLAAKPGKHQTADELPSDSKGELQAQPLRVLIVEDSENDALLMEIDLQRAGDEPICERVETREAVNAALSSQRWDLVIADYLRPRFNGFEALALITARACMLALS